MPGLVQGMRERRHVSGPLMAGCGVLAGGVDAHIYGIQLRSKVLFPILRMVFWPQRCAARLYRVTLSPRLEWTKFLRSQKK